ncbi:MAG: hypothetical protein SGPRY_007913, partial [Prymnesium sp.]
GYAAFREMLRLPPAEEGPSLLPLQPLPSPPLNPLAVAKGAMCLAVKREAEARREERLHWASTLGGDPPHSGGEEGEEGYDELETIDELELTVGTMRDMCKSPQYHKVQLDNFIPDEEEREGEGEGEEEGAGGGQDEGEGGESGDEAESEWVHVSKDVPLDMTAAMAGAEAGEREGPSMGANEEEQGGPAPLSSLNQSRTASDEM